MQRCSLSQPLSALVTSGDRPELSVLHFAAQKGPGLSSLYALHDKNEETKQDFERGKNIIY